MIKKIKALFSKIRYQKIVTTFLYASVLCVMGFTFWNYFHIGGEVNPEIYNKTLDTLFKMLAVTGGLKIGEVVGDTAKDIAEMKYDAGSEMRGGE